MILVDININSGLVDELVVDTKPAGQASTDCCWATFTN